MKLTEKDIEKLIEQVQKSIPELDKSVKILEREQQKDYVAPAVDDGVEFLRAFHKKQLHGQALANEMNSMIEQLGLWREAQAIVHTINHISADWINGHKKKWEKRVNAHDTNPQLECYLAIFVAKALNNLINDKDFQARIKELTNGG